MIMIIIIIITLRLSLYLDCANGIRRLETHCKTPQDFLSS